MKVYTYQPGAFGTSIAQALEGTVRVAGEPTIPQTRFIEGSGLSFNTIPPSDYRFFEMINENVQNQPATSYDVELAGQLAAIGIVHGKPFNPDDRMKKILNDAAAVGQATGRALNWRYAMKHPDWAYYEGSHWGSMLWEGGASFETPPPLFEQGMFKPLPATGARTLDSRSAFYYAYTLDTPGMIMRIPGVGSQYLMGFLDADGQQFDGAKTYKVALPKGIPAASFWSFTLYDNQTRSMLQTPQKYPRAGSQSYPSPAAKADANGVTTVYFGPNNRMALLAVTGFRPTQRKAGSRSCVCTAHFPHSSTRAGGQARSSQSGEPFELIAAGLASPQRPRGLMSAFHPFRTFVQPTAA